MQDCRACSFTFSFCPSRPRRNSSSSSSPSERPRQKLSRKAASSANLLLRSGSTERWVSLPFPPQLAVPQSQFLDFLPSWVGWVTSLPNRKKETKHSLGLLQCSGHCAEMLLCHSGPVASSVGMWSPVLSIDQVKQHREGNQVSEVTESSSEPIFS